MVYVNCPKCGHKVLEGETGSIVQVKCNKCNCILKAVLSENEVQVTVKQRAG